MFEARSDLLQSFVERGYLHQCTDLQGLDDLARQEPIIGYIGFDCTADSLHVGSLIPIMLLRHMQRTGNKPIVLLGGGTTKIGDPSGRDQSRQLLGEEEIANNMASLKKSFERYLVFGEGPTDAMIVNNGEWLSELNYVDFLRDYGRHFSVNKMLGFDSVKLRLEREQPLSFLEFNYMILQAYDFLELNKNTNCLMQIGGSDQWGNIVNGVELIKRHSNKQVFGLTTPLITLASGSKMGKTEKGAVWLDKKLLPAYDYWQFWRNTDDRDVLRFLQMFTDLSLEKIEELKNKNINQLKIILANEATSMLHGKAAAVKAEQTAKNTFEKKSVGADLPTLVLKKEQVINGINIVDLVTATNLSNSKSEVRRMIKNKGIKVNNETIESDKFNISINNFGQENFLKLSHGKKKHVIIKIN